MVRMTAAARAMAVRGTRSIRSGLAAVDGLPGSRDDARTKGAHMEQHSIGDSGVWLSAVGLGGVPLGDSAQEPDQVSRAVAVLHAAVDAGVNWVDTSENYFDTRNEELLEAALRDMPGQIQICSKLAPGAKVSGGGSGFRPAQVRQGCEASLARLGVEVIDMYLLHWPDESGVPIEDTWGAMASLVDDGLVRTIGLSNFDRQDTARCHAQRPVDVIQTGLSILDYLEDRDLIAWCGEHGMTVTIYEPLAGGVLTEVPLDQVRAKYVGTPWEDSGYFRLLFGPETSPRTEQVIDGLREIAARLDITVALLALGWVLAQPGVASAVVGSSSPDRARTNATAADLHLAGTTLAAIEELIPLGPSFA
jgi:aryl-alcohol dehydrogenase-like predicted oxidoreductase